MPVQLVNRGEWQRHYSSTNEQKKYELFQQATFTCPDNSSDHRDPIKQVFASFRVFHLAALV